MRTDTKWKLWFKWAKLVQFGEANAPKATNSMRQLKVKVLKSYDHL